MRRLPASALCTCRWPTVPRWSASTCWAVGARRRPAKRRRGSRGLKGACDEGGHRARGGRKAVAKERDAPGRTSGVERGAGCSRVHPPPIAGPDRACAHNRRYASDPPPPRRPGVPLHGSDPHRRRNPNARTGFAVLFRFIAPSQRVPLPGCGPGGRRARLVRASVPPTIAPARGAWPAGEPHGTAARRWQRTATGRGVGMSDALTSGSDPSQRVSTYPGCDRPAAPAPAGGGRPPAYCDRADHHPTSAFRARQHAQGRALTSRGTSSRAR